MQKDNLYQKFMELKNEIEKHKWIESEKNGRDIGFEKALLDWIIKYRSNWRTGRSKSMRVESTSSQ
jgi:hypothetical protein